MAKELYTKEDYQKWGRKGGEAKGRDHKNKKFIERSKELGIEERFDLGTAPFDEPLID